MGTGDEDGDDPTFDDEAPTDWQRALAEGHVGDAVLMGLLLPEEWVHRRVETVTFADPALIRRSVSVDLTLGFATPVVDIAPGCRLVALTSLRKRVLSSLDVVDASGGSLSVLTSAQNGRLATTVLRTLVATICGEEHVDRVQHWLGRIATLPSQSALAQRDELLSFLDGLGDADPLRELAAFDEYLQHFAENFLLVAVVRGSLGDRVIVKFAYEEPASLAPEDVSWPRRLGQSLGWIPREYIIDIPAAISTESFHVEIASPNGMAINGAALFEHGIDAAVESGGADGGETAAIARRGTDRAHFHAAGTCTSAAQVIIWLRIAREGWLRSAVLVTLTVVVLGVASFFRLDELLAAQAAGQKGSTTDVAALLMAVVGLLASVALRIGEHPVTARAVLTLRIVTLAAVGIPLLQGWSLAFGPQSWALELLWKLLAIASVVFAAVVIVAYIGPGSVTPNAYDSDDDPPSVPAEGVHS